MPDQTSTCPTRLQAPDYKKLQRYEPNLPAEIFPAFPGRSNRADVYLRSEDKLVQAVYVAANNLHRLRDRIPDGASIDQLKHGYFDKTIPEVLAATLNRFAPTHATAAAVGYLLAHGWTDAGEEEVKVKEKSYEQDELEWAWRRMWLRIGCEDEDADPVFVSRTIDRVGLVELRHAFDEEMKKFVEKARTMTLLPNHPGPTARTVTAGVVQMEVDLALTVLRALRAGRTVKVVQDSVVIE